MKKCKTTKLIERYINGELNDKQNSMVKSHLKNCPICQEEFKKLSMIDEFLGMYSDEDLPSFLNSKVLNKISSEEKKVNKKFGFLNIIPVAASFIAAFIFGFYLSSATMQTTEPDFITMGSDSFYSLL